MASSAQTTQVDLGDEAVEAGLVLRLGAGDQHVLRVRGAQQPPAVVGADADAVGRVDLGAVGGEALADFVDDRELARFVDLEAQLGRRDRLGHRVHASRSGSCRCARPPRSAAPRRRARRRSRTSGA
jgi:uncharacterized protein (UPF0264 family)